MKISQAHAFSSDIAFTPAVKAIQARKGSRGGYAGMEQRGSWQTTITPDLAGFIAEQTSVFLATANADGQPYIQHRGGPAGFLRVLDDKTIGFADFAGNRQYITLGNLAENPKAYLFLIDYAHGRRIKIWGTAGVVEGDDALTASLMPKDYKARGEQVFLFTIEAWDSNCPSISLSGSKRPMLPQRSPSGTVTLKRWKPRLCVCAARPARAPVRLHLSDRIGSSLS
jgi:predicted pyridoxine 5'-phosphate oxidase superfamily flavin-nucleotide-binding protein